MATDEHSPRLSAYFFSMNLLNPVRQRSIHFFLRVISISSITASIVEGQLPALGVRVISRPDSSLPVTAVEAAYHVDLQRKKKRDDEYTQYRLERFHKDSLAAVIR